MEDHADDLMFREIMDGMKQEFEFFGGKKSNEYKTRTKRTFQPRTEGSDRKRKPDCASK